MTNAERQRRWREGHKYTSRRLARERMRRLRAPEETAHVRNVRNEEPNVRNVPREVQETSYVSMDSVEGDADVMREHWERMEKYRPPVVAPAKKVPVERVVAEVQTAEERRIAEWLERKKVDRPTGDVMSGTGIEVEMDAI